jgi:hypothetical protein
MPSSRQNHERQRDQRIDGPKRAPYMARHGQSVDAYRFRRAPPSPLGMDARARVKPFVPLVPRHRLPIPGHDPEMWNPVFGKDHAQSNC